MVRDVAQFFQSESGQSNQGWSAGEENPNPQLWECFQRSANEHGDEKKVAAKKRLAIGRKPRVVGRERDEQNPQGKTCQRTIYPAHIYDVLHSPPARLFNEGSAHIDSANHLPHWERNGDHCPPREVSGGVRTGD